MLFSMRRSLRFCTICIMLLSLCSLFFQSSSARAAGSTVQVWLTTSDGSSQLAQQSDIPFGGNTGNASTIRVNESKTFQQMTGFGAAVTDSSAWLINNKMNGDQRNALMQKLFDSGRGIGMSFVRIPMGASDFSINGPYSYDDLPAGQRDPDLTHFSIDHDRAYILPVLKQAHSLNSNLTFMANPWSPPAWMKTNDSMIGTGNGSTGTLNGSDYGSLAQYFVKFIQAYQAQGVPIFAVSPVNEPEYPPSNYPGLYLSANDESSFIKNNLSPALANAGLSTKILGYDHNWDDPNYPLALLSDPTTRNDLAGIAWHCYSGSPTNMTRIYTYAQNVGAYETECSTGAAVAPISTADLLMQSVQNYAKTVELWNLALDPNRGPHSGGCPDCLGVVTIDQGSGNVTYRDDYYQVGHYSKFVVPGAYRIASNSLGSLADVAFKNPDGSKVVVAHNDGSNSSDFQVQWGDQGFNYTLPAGATVTFKWSGTQTGDSGPPIGSVIWLQATNSSNYVSARNDQNGAPLKASENQVQLWEVFDVVDAGDGLVALRSHSNNNYVSTRVDEANSPLKASVNQLQAWEKFRWLPRSNGTVALQSVQNNNYVSARADQNGDPLFASVNQIQGWEEFQWGQAV